MKVVQVVDSREYVAGNCYQHQLLADLRRNSDHHLAVLNETTDLPTDAVILSTVKIRNVYKHIDRFAKMCKDRKVYFYDQDPWESFLDTATYPNGYTNVLSRIPSAEFVVTSGWWCKFINDRGIKAHLCRMWILPEYCSYGEAFENRSVDVVFRGRLHPFRKRAIDALNGCGTNVVTVPSTPDFSEWLSWLRTQRIFFHDEAEGWLINGKLTPKQCAMPKEVEIASQGCFALRDSQSMEELRNYGLDKVPCVLTYSSYEECTKLVQWVNSLSHVEANQLIRRSVDQIKSVGGWADMRLILA